ncbi:MAG: hypothetical protein K9H61_08060 [Bacteroidia bacterium]|nr:hypothetical protein [Bacteroidia bacterium]MCF8426631.1 hypothetical protein [Bacteroidia bacterium]MCF8446935.1 hypothetical protein [Bacteroidia bacterium]
MKNNYSWVIALSIITATTIMACNSPAQKVENAKDKLSDAREELSQAQKDSVADYENFKMVSESRIAKNEELIQAYKQSMKDAKKEWKSSDQKIVDELEQKNINMRKKMEEYRNEGRDKWQDFKTEFNHDMDELGNAINDLTIKNTR